MVALFRLPHSPGTGAVVLTRLTACTFEVYTTAMCAAFERTQIARPSLQTMTVSRAGAEWTEAPGMFATPLRRQVLRTASEAECGKPI